MKSIKTICLFYFGDGSSKENYNKFLDVQVLKKLLQFKGGFFVDEQITELIQVIKQSQYGFDWPSTISAICALISVIAVLILVKERIEKNRPYLQISFELLRSTLTCIVIRNVGNVPLTVKSILFDSFITQLSPETIVRLEKLKIIDINIFPNNKLVISFDNNVFEIINKFSLKKVTIDYNYTKLGKKKVFKENITIDFEQYSSMLLYLSELDEFKQSTDKIVKSLNKITQLKDGFEKYI